MEIDQQRMEAPPVRETPPEHGLLWKPYQKTASACVCKFRPGEASWAPFAISLAAGWSHVQSQWASKNPLPKIKKTKKRLALVYSLKYLWQDDEDGGSKSKLKTATHVKVAFIALIDCAGATHFMWKTFQRNLQSPNCRLWRRWVS